MALSRFNPTSVYFNDFDLIIEVSFDVMDLSSAYISMAANEGGFSQKLFVVQLPLIPLMTGSLNH
jgi:hypothetical protein